jgi:hypothetical protein
MAAHRYRRNSLRYQTGGGVVSDQEKFAEYDAAGAKLWDEYKQWVQDSKRAYNVESGWELIS